MPNPTHDLHFLRDPYPTYATLRAACPVQQVPTGSGGHASYLVTSHAEARAALADPGLSKDTAAFFADKNSRRRLHPAVAHNMLATDPPQHTRLRKLVTKAFTTGAVTELRPFIAQTTEALLTRWPAGETVDFVAGLAVPLPVIVICELLGIPEEDRPTVQRWSRDLFAAGKPEFIDAASHHLADYMTNLVAIKRSAPGNTLRDRLISAHDDDTRLTEEELASLLAVLLFIAGHETTTNFLGNATLALLQYPTALRRLRESPHDLPAALDELLRYDAPLSLTTFRYTTELLHTRRRRHPDRHPRTHCPGRRQPRPPTIPGARPPQPRPRRYRPPQLRPRHPPLRRRTSGQGRSGDRPTRRTDPAPPHPARRATRRAALASHPPHPRTDLPPSPRVDEASPRSSATSNLCLFAGLELAVPRRTNRYRERRIIPRAKAVTKEGSERALAFWVTFGA